MAFMSGINRNKEEEEENVYAGLSRDERPTCDTNTVKRA